MKKLLKIFIILPVAAVLIAFSIANRHGVRLSLDPFSSKAPAIAFDNVPLYLLLFASVLAGIIIGGAAAWIGQGKWRRRAREQSGEAAQWRAKVRYAEQKAQNTLPAPQGGGNL